MAYSILCSSFAERVLLKSVTEKNDQPCSNAYNRFNENCKNLLETR